jgi:hypothetical protein
VKRETVAHRCLKRLAAIWAYERGFRCLGLEVSAPRSNYRVDVAAYRSYRVSENRTPTVAVFECKQSREDLLRDSKKQQELSELLGELQQRKGRLEALLQVHHPSLRRSDDLFPEWCTYDFSILEHDAYRQVSQKIAVLQRQLIKNTKFDRFRGYRLADLNYLVAPPGIVWLSEVPAGWGLLESSNFLELTERVPAGLFQSKDCAAWLERIARSASLALIKGWEPERSEAENLTERHEDSKV